MPMPAVLDLDDGLVALLAIASPVLHAQLDAAAGIGIFGGIGEKVVDDLRETHQVAFDCDRLFGQIDHELVLTGFDQRAACLYRASYRDL